MTIKRVTRRSPNLLIVLQNLLDEVELVDVDFSKKFGSDHFLRVTRHHATTRCEIVWIVHKWRHDQWNVWCVHCTRFQELVTTEAH